jgi:tetratricopeptide (TPR) repeat protein
MADQSTLDDRTAEVIRTALAVAKAGRLEEAYSIGRRGLAEGGEAVTLHALLGAFLCAAQDFNGAISHLEIAHGARPTDPVVTRNLATAYHECGRTDDAANLITDAALASDPTGGLLRLSAFLAQSGGRTADAIDAYERVVERHSTDWESWNNLGNVRLEAGDQRGGIAALERAAALNPGAVATRTNLALALREAGLGDRAAAELRQMAADFPRDPAPLGYLFGLLQEQGWDRDAEDALRLAIDRDPTNIGMLIALGRQELLRFAIEDAQRTFRRVLELDPTNGDAFLGLADGLEHQSPEGLPALVAEAESAGIDAHRLNLMRALLARREKDFAKGVLALKEIPDDFDPVRRWHLQGQLLDGVGEYDGAFEAYSRMNEVLAREPTNPLARAAELREQLRDRLTRTTSEWRQAWATPPLPSDRPAPVFLLGFPRSGTTLLDTMLLGHPRVEVMEERPVLAQLRTEGGDFESLAAMSADDVRRSQNRYFELAADYAPLTGNSLLVDKSPLHLQSLPQIYRLFPDAKVILALRHPADVVLSCFMAKFRMNASMSNFVQLDTIAEFYDLTFALWEKSLALFPVEVHRVVYERMIEDPEAVLRPIVENLGLDWQPEIVDHQRTAKKRGVITTASYAQVTEPLYRGAAGRWQRYRKHLKPILPVLQPWTEKFGYEQ